MSSKSNPLALNRLIEQLASLPGIGMKTASRLAYHILTLSNEQAKNLSSAIIDAHNNIKRCPICQNFTDGELCKVCSDAKRERDIICVVEMPKDIMAFERTKEYHGLYHVLHGLISPMDGIGPEHIYVKELITRVGKGDIKEVIMATNPTVEGEATAMYISKLLKPLGVKVSRLAYGIPVGSELEYADEITLFKALENRNEI